MRYLRRRTERRIVPCIHTSIIGRCEAMIFGAITNSWRQQLDGQDLAVLVQEAQTGARHIEFGRPAWACMNTARENTGGQCSPSREV